MAASAAGTDPAPSGAAGAVVAVGPSGGGLAVVDVDGRFELHIHAEITTDDFERILTINTKMKNG